MSKKILDGKVVKDKNDKTIGVLVKRRYTHPFFKKVMTSSKKYHVHDEKEVSNEGDTVLIQECKPISKTKSWVLLDVLKKGETIE